MKVGLASVLVSVFVFSLLGCKPENDNTDLQSKARQNKVETSNQTVKFQMNWKVIPKNFKPIQYINNFEKIVAQNEFESDSDYLQRLKEQEYFAYRVNCDWTYASYDANNEQYVVPIFIREFPGFTAMHPWSALGFYSWLWETNNVTIQKINNMKLMPVEDRWYAKQKYFNIISNVSKQEASNYKRNLYLLFIGKIMPINLIPITSDISKVANNVNLKAIWLCEDNNGKVLEKFSFED